jgi:hypothetical protein
MSNVSFQHIVKCVVTWKSSQNTSFNAFTDKFYKHFQNSFTMNLKNPDIEVNWILYSSSLFGGNLMSTDFK